MNRKNKIRRFTATERFMHWSFAVPQIVLMITGGWLLLFASQSGESVLKARIILLHKIAGVGFILFPILVFMGGNSEALLENIKLILRWKRKDVSWLARSFIKTFRPSTELPEVGKFNPGQKLNMLLVMAVGPMFVLTGLLMWLLDGVLLAWVAHTVLFGVVVFIVLGHVYMAILHPSTRPSFWAIVTGHVDWEWARHHHPEWANDLRETNEAD